MKILEAKINESKEVQKQCKLLLNMLNEVDKNVKNKINQIVTLDKSGEASINVGQLDEAREKLDDFMSYIMKLKV